MIWLKKLIGNVIGLGENLTKPEQYWIKEEKRYKYRINAAMKYVHVIEKSGRFKEMKPKELRKWRLHYRKRIFDAK